MLLKEPRRFSRPCRTPTTNRRAITRAAFRPEKCAGYRAGTQTDFCLSTALFRDNILSLTVLRRGKFFEVLSASCRQRFQPFFPMFLRIIELRNNSPQPAQPE
jgi:hypothetical protein